MNYRRLLDDFLVGDRRIADRTDIKIRVDSSAGKRSKSDKSERLFTRIDFASPRRLFTYLFGTPPDLTVLEIVADHELSDREGKLITILGPLIAYFEAEPSERRSSDLSRRIGSGLQEVRQSLNRSQDSVADDVRTTRSAVSSWESGARSPGTEAMYRWCQSLGLVSPPKTVLVRVVDIAPELIRLLEEDPARLRQLTPDHFERFIADRIDRMGYSVQLAGATNRKDGGIDLIAVPKVATLGSVVIAGQIKHHRGDQKTGRDAVDRLLAWKDSAFHIGVLVTNTTFTNDALWTAQQQRNKRFLRLRDLGDLKRWLQGQYGTEEDWREIPDTVELAPGVVIEIPKPRIISPFATSDDGQ